MKIRIHKFLNESRFGSGLIAVIVLVSLTVFTLETEFQDARWLKQLGLIIAALFALEYVLRVWVSDLSEGGRSGYIKSFSGAIDLVAFLPALFIAGAGASVVLRAFRVFRLLQLLKIGAISRGIKRIQTALSVCKGELGVSMILSFGLIFIGAVLIYFVEGTRQPEAFGSIPRSLWWSIATLTTVGYGDVYPISALGKLIAAAIAIVGIGAVALPAGIIASAFMSVDKVER